MKTAHVPIRLPAHSAPRIEGISLANRRSYIYDICAIIRPILISACQFLPSIKEKSRSTVGKNGLWPVAWRDRKWHSKTSRSLHPNSGTHWIVGERHVERLLIRDKTLVRPLLSIRRVHLRREHDPRISSSGIPYGAFTCMLKACFKEAVRSKKSAQENTKIRGHRE